MMRNGSIKARKLSVLFLVPRGRERAREKERDRDRVSARKHCLIGRGLAFATRQSNGSDCRTFYESPIRRVKRSPRFLTFRLSSRTVPNKVKHDCRRNVPAE